MAIGIHCTDATAIPQNSSDASTSTAMLPKCSVSFVKAVCAAFTSALVADRFKYVRYKPFNVRRTTSLWRTRKLDFSAL